MSWAYKTLNQNRLNCQVSTTTRYSFLKSISFCGVYHNAWIPLKVAWFFFGSINLLIVVPQAPYPNNPKQSSTPASTSSNSATPPENNGFIPSSLCWICQLESAKLLRMYDHYNLSWLAHYLACSILHGSRDSANKPCPCRWQLSIK